ncbi:hypothetical protein FIU95_07800 [Microbulbifer sp. THAF38]|nr:hypothetical protein FIU95_07800 [Microbulbifer sp. THAF38]
MIYGLIGIVFFVWVIFFGGASRLENTLVGYFEFGQAGEKAIYIKMVSWIGLVFSVGFLFFGSSS